MNHPIPYSDTEPDPDLEQALTMFRTEEPSRYGIFSSSFNDVATLLEDTSKPYPTAKDLYKHHEDIKVHPPGIGCVLTGLAELDVIDIYTERRNSTRYDLTNLDRQRLDQIRTHLTSTDPHV